MKPHEAIAGFRLSAIAGARLRPLGGYTFVEILVAAVIAALTLTVATVAFGAIIRHGRPGGGLVTVVIGTTFNNNFYGINNANIDTPVAPSYSSAGLSEVLRQELEDDIASASAVFVLARNEINTIRPTVLSNITDAVAKTLTTPDAFRALIDPSGAVYDSYQTVTGTNSDSSSIYILSPSTNSGEVNVRAIYETDIFRTVSPQGHYASVRRYEGNQTGPTTFYHIFYPSSSESPDTNSFRPLAAFFDRAVTTNGNTNLDRFRVASNRPFYFVWWPDPAARKLDLTNNAPTNAPTNSPRSEYYKMAGRTPLFMVVPAFPAL